MIKRFYIMTMTSQPVNAAVQITTSMAKLSFLNRNLTKAPMRLASLVRFLAFGLVILDLRQVASFSKSTCISNHPKHPLLAASEDDDNFSSIESVNRRNLLWQVPVATVAAYSYGKLFRNVLSVQGIKYPAAHESRVKKIITDSLELSGASKDTKDTFRILEVGIGSDCRLSRRGLYATGLQKLQEQGYQHVDVVGLDVSRPSQSTLDEAKNVLMEASPVEVDLDFVQSSITSTTPFLSGYFDAVICCFTLCSVDDPENAIQEMNRLVRRSGGTFGYIEHVAVDPDEPYKLLDWEQRKLDRVQQIVADNCHLHRSTDKTIQQVMGASIGESSLIESKRFVVDNMWPVSMQSVGMVQKRVL